MAKADNTRKLLTSTESQMTYLEWQRKMLEAMISDLEEVEVEDE